MSLKNLVCKALFLTLVCSASVAETQAAETKDSTTVAKVNYIPQIHGTIRGRFEASTVESKNRFQVRNARVNIRGNIAPIADYYLQADFCDRGTIKMLDAWARVWVTKSIGMQAGQFRMPFGVDPFRAPGNYIFANRSFIGKDISNVRAVGAKFMWHPTNLPLTLEAGAFNPTTISDHTSWHNKLAYAAKLTYRIHNVTLATGIQSLAPDSIRTNLFDFGTTWKHDRWLVEGEYMYKHYTNDSHKPCHAYNIYADYHMPIKTAFFNRLSFQGRFDGMTAHSTAKRNKNGVLETNNPACNRVTLGATITYIRSKSMSLDLRVNYEKYFYHKDVKPTVERGDKATIEFVLNF